MPDTPYAYIGLHERCRSSRPFATLEEVVASRLDPLATHVHRSRRRRSRQQETWRHTLRTRVALVLDQEQVDGVESETGFPPSLYHVADGALYDWRESVNGDKVKGDRGDGYQGEPGGPFDYLKAAGLLIFVLAVVWTFLYLIVRYL